MATRKKNMFKTKRQMFGKRKRKPCYYCGRTLTLDTATFDHVIPRSDGGYDKKKNGVIACGYCNNKKGSMSVSEFLHGRSPYKKCR